jgi:hypothetical protein
MINFEGSQIIWNKKQNRPATGDEIYSLIAMQFLLINFSTRSEDGKAWLDLADPAEKEFEIRHAAQHGAHPTGGTLPALKPLSAPEVNLIEKFFSVPPTSG